MMTNSRYAYVRERIFELYEIIAHRSYMTWVAPQCMMSIEELRGRYEYRQEGFANDTDFYSTPQLRQMKIPQIVDLLGNITSISDIGFRDANRVVVEIYETIQEYIRLWCEIMTSNMGLGSPPKEELRSLESLAYLIFPIYKPIKLFTVNQTTRELYKDDRVLEAKGLAGFAHLFSMTSVTGPRTEADYSFISHLDDLESSASDYIITDTVNTAGPTFLGGASLTDSIAKMDLGDSDNNWIFKG